MQNQSYLPVREDVHKITELVGLGVTSITLNNLLRGYVDSATERILIQAGVFESGISLICMWFLAQCRSANRKFKIKRLFHNQPEKISKLRMYDRLRYDLLTYTVSYEPLVSMHDELEIMKQKLMSDFDSK
jgi:hypothetical protein